MNKEIKDLINFDIRSNEAGRIEARLRLDASLPSFAGHFPNNPILPAVSVIDFSLYLLDGCGFPAVHNKIAVKRSKFIGMIRPEQMVSVIAEERSGDQWTVTWYAEEDQSRLAVVNLERKPN